MLLEIVVRVIPRAIWLIVILLGLIGLTVLLLASPLLAIVASAPPTPSTLLLILLTLSLLLGLRVAFLLGALLQG
jgi:hypothetical protein